MDYADASNMPIDLTNPTPIYGGIAGIAIKDAWFYGQTLGSKQETWGFKTQIRLNMFVQVAGIPIPTDKSDPDFLA